MTSDTPLTGVVLVDCARANAKGGLAIAAKQCGYGNSTASFQSALQAACSEMGVEINSLSDLLSDEAQPEGKRKGIEVAPESKNDL